MRPLRLYRELDALAADFPRAPYLAIGTFDGVHRGHQAVVRALVRSATRAGAPAAVLTFVPHPATVLRNQAPPALTTGPQRARLLEAMGVQALVEMVFDDRLARVSSAEFVREYLCRRARARRVFVGADFTFGAGGQGTPETLAVLGRQTCGMETTTVELVHLAGEPVSSTRIRQALTQGRPALAARLLGRPFTLEGRVVPGDGRGRQIGFPTANVALPEDLVMPLPGVYVVWCGIHPESPDVGSSIALTLARGLRLGGRPTAGPAGITPVPGVANLGLRPTFQGFDLRLEVHLLGFEGSLYGQLLEVAFVRRLRGERYFPDVAALQRQIAADVRRAHTLLTVQR